MSATAAAMAQVNIRMTEELKRAGDATLERADISPTQLVRAVWAKLAMGTEALDQLMAALAQSPSPQVDADGVGSQAGDALVSRIARRQEGFEQAFNLDAGSYIALTDEELEDLLYEERLQRERERMTWHVK